MATKTTSTQTTILGRLFANDDNHLSTSAARYFLKLEFSSEDRERMQHLAAKASEGTLTDAEQDEINQCELVGHFLSIVKSKARQTLQHSTRSK